MSNYIKNTQKVLKAYNEGVVKPQINSLNGEIVKVNTELDAKITQTLLDAKGYTDDQVAIVEGKVVALEGVVGGHVQDLNGKIVAANTRVDGVVSDAQALEGRVATNETDIANLKNAISNKNNNTLVVETVDQLPTEGMKVGDLVFVISEKRVYIYKSEVEKFVVLDELTNELDLVDYAKIEYVDGKIAEVNGTINAVKGELEAECGLKATKVELAEEVKTLNDKINGLVVNGGDTTQEIERVKQDLAATKNRVEANENNIAELTTGIAGVRATVNTHETRIAVLEGKTDSQGNRIGNLEEKVATLEVHTKELTESEIQSIIDFIKA